MSRRTRPVPFARMRLDSALRDLRARPATEWPKHLRLARQILVDELNVDERTARAVLLACFAVAHGCARAINQRSRDGVNTAGSLKLRKVFARLARCVRRSPAVLRGVLDSDLRSFVRDTIMDAESMEALIDRLISAFATLPKQETSQTVLRAIVPRRSLPKLDKLDPADLQSRFAEASVFFKDEYSALHAVDQRRVESALTALGRKRAKFGAADVCEAVAGALDYSEGNATRTAIADLITDYVAAAAKIWRQQGIRATRAVHPDNRDYRGKFHRFVDLVLTSIVEPWSKRYDGNQRETAAKLYEAYVQKSVSPVARRSDVECLVSDDHVIKAVARLKKPAPRKRRNLCRGSLTRAVHVPR